jgi:hypothetical protein
MESVARRRARGEPWAPNNGAVQAHTQPEQGGRGDLGLDGMEFARRLRERAFFPYRHRLAGASPRCSGNGRDKAEDWDAHQPMEREGERRGPVVQKRDVSVREVEGKQEEAELVVG